MKKRLLFLLLLASSVLMVRAEVVYTGSHSTGSWNALRLTPTDYAVLTNLQAGDVLAITMTADDPTACVMLQDGNWGTLTDTYVNYDAPSGMYAYALNAADAATIASIGVCVTGSNYTISKVEIYYHDATIWTGSVSDNSGWAQSEALSNSLFASLTAGDLLGIEIGAINDGANWHQYAVYANWRTSLFSGLRSSAGIGVHALTADIVDSLQNQAVTLAAQYLDITAVHTYVATKSTQPAGTTQSIWTGSVVMPSNWTAWQTIPATAFANAQVGQLLRCRFTALGANAQLQLKETTQWNELIDAPLAFISGRYYDYTITADMLAELQARGVIVSGCNYTLIEVLLINPADLRPLTLSVPVTNNWVYATRPTITIHAENPYAEAVIANAEIIITTDKMVPVDTLTAVVNVAANASEDIVLTPDADLAAGFYNATCIVNDDLARAFVFAINPPAIISAPDTQSDFASFWATAKTQLEAIEMNPVLTEITAKSTTNRKVYLVEFNSIPDGLTGEPVVVRGYYCEPQDGQRHPVIMHYLGYDSGYRPGGQDVMPYCPSGDAEPSYAEFYLSTRGQSINNRPAAEREPDGKGDFTNTYGDWFAFNFGDKDSYYYRGAFMDCVQAIRFMATRSTSDMRNLFGEGQSQGGAFTYAAAALSSYPFRAIAPGIAFLGDFPDYFDIVNWPASVARAQRDSLGMTDAEMYEFLSYFDTKNLAPSITAATLACLGLQDNVCPPHTNIAPYNNLNITDKQLIINPELGHQAAGSWYADYMAFFAARCQQGGATGMEAVGNQSAAVCKIVENGHLFLMYNGTMYNVQGQIVQ